MNNIRLFSLIFLVSIFSYTSAQDFHASTTKIEIDAGELRLTSKFFTVDLEKAVGASTSNKSDFDNKAKVYLEGKMTLKVNGVPVILIYNGSQTNDKSTRIYLKAVNISDIKELEVRNSMLIEIFEDQQNLLTFDINGVRKSLTTKKGTETGKITF